MLPRFLVVLGFLVGTLLAAPASAQSDADKATARNLFFEAKAAYDAGRYEEAAGLFERSNSIFPAPTAALGIARSLRDAGQLVRAHETYRAMIVAGVPEDASPAFKQALDAAKKDQAALEPRLPALVIQATGAAAPAVTIDGVAIPEAALGVKRFVDPGEHEIVATAEGHREARETVEVAEGETREVKLMLEAITMLPGPLAPKPPTPPPPLGRSEDEATGGMSGMAIAGLVVGAVGVVALGVGAVTGGLYLGKKSIVDDNCTEVADGRICNDVGAAAADRGRTFGLVNTILMPVGVAALGTGLLLFLLAPDDEASAVAPVVGPGLAGVTFRTRF